MFYYNLSDNFWNLIQGRYRYATGGVGNGEMFRQPYTQILSMVMNGVSEGENQSNPHINETCCAYNLLKLTKDLNCFHPDDARYMDYYERTLYNQIVGSLHPEHYQTTYQYAVGLDASKPWGNETPQSTCCGGTGSENHVKYQEATYFISDNALWVALYMPTTLYWQEKGVTIQQECLWPAENTTIRVKEGEADFAMKLRVPYWATEGFDVKLNGVSVASQYKPCSYVVIPDRHWNAGDIVEVTMPFTKHIDYGPDKLPGEIASPVVGDKLETSWVGTLMYGPLVMTATDITNWTEATLNIDSQLASVSAAAPAGMRSGTAGNLYTLTQGGRTFQPDYYRHDHTTHYFRIHHVTDPTAELKTALSERIREASIFDKKNYTKLSFTSLQKALKEGDDLMNAPSVTETGISTCIEKIKKAEENLVASRLDKSLLEEAIQQASVVDASQYTYVSYKSLQTVLQASNEVLKASDIQKMVDKQTLLLKDALKALVMAGSVDKGALKELLVVASERREAQEKWNALEVKVPEYAPWARFGYSRMQQILQEAQAIYDNKDKNYSQVEVNSIVASLGTAVNTMRPGNLPEMEDLRPLSALLRRAGAVDESTEPALKEAVEYAEMVMKYVADGSGTRDMIDTAVNRLKKATGQ